MPCELNEALVIASTIVLYRVIFNFFKYSFFEEGDQTPGCR